MTLPCDEKLAASRLSKIQPTGSNPSLLPIHITLSSDFSVGYHVSVQFVFGFCFFCFVFFLFCSWCVCQGMTWCDCVQAVSRWVGRWDSEDLGLWLYHCLRCRKEGSITVVILSLKAWTMFPSWAHGGLFGGLVYPEKDSVIDEVHEFWGRMLYRADQVAELLDEADVDTDVVIVQFLFRISAAEGYSWDRFLMRVGATTGEYIVLHC